MYAYQVGKNLKMRYDHLKEQQYGYVATIDSDYEDDLYDFMMKWAIDHAPATTDMKNVSLVSTWKDGRNLIYRSSRSNFGQVFDIDGHEVAIKVKTINNFGMGEDDASGPSGRSRELQIMCKTQHDLDVVLDFFIDYLSKQVNSDTEDERAVGIIRKRYYEYARGAWPGTTYVPRELDSVILKDGEVESLVEDIVKFIQLKPEYLRTSIPWHRGYLFHGPPGTGKTSLALSLASSLNIPIFVMSLGNIKTDTELTGAIRMMKQEAHTGEAILILEDVDTAIPTSDRSIVVPEGDDDSPSGGLTLGGLLNVLDGIGTPSGLITIMTTNYRDRLDPALIRPGRVDFELEIGYLDQKQLEDLITWYIGEIPSKDIPLIKEGVQITPAQITGIVKNHLAEPVKCLDEIIKFVEKENESV